MCQKCEEIDVQIARCERLLGQMTDKLFLDGVGALVKSYHAEKAALHPEEKK